ncbi:MAG: PAS domain S-box protein [Bacteroidetes bacterium]|nr:PAS domain S-box protein [Bacteroidota bacterium]
MMDNTEKPNILIVDDSENNIFLLEAYLSLFDINILRALSGQEALDMIQGRELALALIDINMPVMDGIELATLITNDKSRNTVPIIFITAYPLADVRQRSCYLSGGVDFLSKPFDKEILISKIRVFLELFRQKQEVYANRQKMIQVANELTRINKSLKESENRYRLLFESSAEAIFIIETDGENAGNILEANKAALLMHGYEQCEILQLKISDLSIPSEKEQRERNIRRMLQGEWLRGETMHVRKDGSHFPAEWSAGSFTTQNKKLILIFVKDITERRLAMDTLIAQEEFLTTIIENIPLMVFVKSAKDLKFVRLNRAGEELLGYPKEDFLGKSDYDFFPKDVADFFTGKDRKVIQSNSLEDIPEEKITTRNQGERILHTKKIPIPGKDGKPEFLLGISEDITMQKKARDLIKESEKLYRTLLNASPEGIIIMDLDGTMAEVSDISLETFRAEKKDDFIGHNFLILVPEEESQNFFELLQKTEAEGVVQNMEFHLLKFNETVFISEISMTLIQEANGKPKAFMAVIRDISQRKKLEQKLIHTERMIGIGEMATSIAHEINQPLNNISLSLENILEEIKLNNAVDEGYLKKKSDNIFGSIMRIGNIIDHIRTFSRDKDDFIPVRFDMNTSIRNAIMLVTAQFKHKGIELIVNLEKNIHPVIGNTFKFEQVILNLLINARDAMEEKMKSTGGYFVMKIEINTFNQGGDSIVEVSDNGYGIRSEDVENIMMPFYTTKEEGKGTGLGLSISAGIIKDMKGTISVTTKFTEGTTFTITIPSTD